MDKQSTSRHAKSVKGITEELPEEEPKLAGQRAAVCVCVYLSATQRGGERKGKKTLVALVHKKYVIIFMTLA